MKPRPRLACNARSTKTHTDQAVTDLRERHVVGVADLIRIQRRIGHAGNGIGLEDNGAVLAHDKIAARDAQATERPMGGTG